jgi:PST family polysaccharide transporter
MKPTNALAAAFATTGVYAAANLVGGVARNKALAVLLGPSGYGQWSQVMSFFYLLQTGAVLGVTTGVARYVAQYRRAGRNPATVIATAGALTLGAGLLLALGAAAAAGPLARWVVGSPAWSGVLALTALAIPLVAAQALFQAGLQGFEDHRALATGAVAGAAASLACAVGAAMVWNARGVAGFVAGSFAAGALVYGRGLWRRLPLWRGARVERALLRGVLAYGGVALAGTALAAAATLAGRSLVLHAYGAAAAGYYQAMSGLTLQILPLFLSGAALYTVPRLAGEGEGARAGAVIGPLIRVLVPLVAAGLALGLALRETFFAVLFTPAFAPAARWFPVQLTGDLFLTLAWASGAHLLPMGRLRTFLWCESARAAVFLAATLALLALDLEPSGALPPAAAHALSYAAEAGLFVGLARRYHGLDVGALAPRFALTAAAWAALLAVTYLAPPPWRLAAWFLGLPAFAAAALTRDEARGLLRRFRPARPSAAA